MIFRDFRCLTPIPLTRKRGQNLNVHVQHLVKVEKTTLHPGQCGLDNAYHTTELGEADCTLISIMDSGQFPDWYENSLAAPS